MILARILDQRAKGATRRDARIRSSLPPNRVAPIGCAAARQRNRKIPQLRCSRIRRSICRIWRGCKGWSAGRCKRRALGAVAAAVANWSPAGRIGAKAAISTLVAKSQGGDAIRAFGAQLTSGSAAELFVQTVGWNASAEPESIVSVWMTSA